MLAVFPRRMKLHFGPTFLRQAQVHAGVGEVGVVTVHILGQTSLVGFDEFIEMVSGPPGRLRVAR